MKFILGTKEEMTQIFDKDGKVHPVTVLLASLNVVTQVKNKKKDGYSAVQVGQGVKNEKNINKAMKGHVKDMGFFQSIREFRVSEDDAHEVGKKIDVSIFEPGDIVAVSSISKGKGFQGVVKRYGFHGGPRTHGQKHTERSIGSIGAQGPQKVHKGKKMPGRMGADRVTVKNLRVALVDKENGRLLIRGSIPGKRGTLVEVRGI